MDHVLPGDVIIKSSSSSSLLPCALPSRVCMMRVLVFCAALCVLHAGVRCLPLVDVKGTRDCDAYDVSMSTKASAQGTGCDGQVTDDVLNAEERHEGLLRELQQLAEQERERKREYTRDTDEYEQQDTDGDEEWEGNDDDDDESMMRKEQNERDLEELLKMKDMQKTQEKKVKLEPEEEELMMEVQKVEKELQHLLEEEMNHTHSWNREQEKQQKQEELQELLNKMSRVKKEQEEKNQTQQKREIEKASDEATGQFEREIHTQMEEDEELLEIEADLRKVAAELREFRRG